MDDAEKFIYWLKGFFVCSAFHQKDELAPPTKEEWMILMNKFNELFN